jgi:Amt family ammonium transporter
MVVGLLVITPVSGFLGPMAAVIVGIVSGFISFMIQKKIVNPSENKPLIIAGITLLVMYAVLTIIIQLASSSHIWDTGDGIGAWTGTPEGIEKP